MTENLAGRGEGLKGLVAQIEALPKVYLHSITDEKRYVDRDRIMTILRAALEAAAPPSTAPPVKHVSSNCPNCGSGDKPLIKIRGYSNVNGNWWLSMPEGECDHPWHIGVAALATPSLQAPQKEQK